MLRGGVIGLGNVAAGVHLPGWARRGDVAIVAATDARPERRDAVAPLLDGARWYPSADALLADADVDFVDICTPPSSHGPLIRAALERGVHVLCEKPLVGSFGELAALARLATTSKRVLHTVHNWHHAPIVARASTLVRDGAIGRVSRVTWQTVRTKPAATQDEANGNWRLDPAIAGGGVLSDHGWHVFYILQAWVNALPTAVTARLETRRHTRYPVEDTATVHVTFPEATADVLLTWAGDARDNRAELTGAGGTIVLEDGVLVLRRGPREERWAIPPPLSSGGVHPEWFDPVAARFLSQVRSETPDPSNLVEASACAALEASARESSRRGGARVALATASLARMGTA